MLHARSDYARIADPAANPALVTAYNDAMNLVAHYDSTEDYAGDAYHRAMRALASLARALSPTLGLLVDAHGVYMPAHPIEADEPVFVLRASDRYAPQTVDAWATLVHDRGKGDSDLSRSAAAHAWAMRDWARTHGGAKTPDAPEGTLVDPDATQGRGARAGNDARSIAQSTSSGAVPIPALSPVQSADLDVDAERAPSIDDRAAL
jgi:hypothetical protein